MEMQWHVVHVCSRTEKKVAERLEKKRITAYLPIQRQLRQWSDRKKWVDMVVVSGYVFVKISVDQRRRTLETPGVSAFLKFDGKPVIISDLEMSQFQNFVTKAESRPIEFISELFPIGTPVTIQSGHFKGCSGEVVMHKGKHKLKIQLSHIGHFSIELLPEEIAIQA